MEAGLATSSPHPLRHFARVGRALLRPLVEGAIGLATTAILVVVITDTVLSRVSLSGVTLNIILRSTSPFRGLGTSEAVAVAVGRSGALLLAALGGAALVGIGAGIAFALSSSRTTRAVTWGLGTVGVALPSFFWAMLLQLAIVTIAVRTGKLLLPSQGYGLDRHLVMPALALAARPIAYLFRTTAVAVEETRHADFIRLARAKGLGPGHILFRHLLPNTAPAVLGGLALAARSTLSSLAIIEYVFDWHGAGYGFIYAVATGDQRLATALVVTFAVLFALVGSATGIAARLIDPRIERQ